jgi:hypothetical protein
MQGFNRNTMWVATGLLGTVIFAALVLAAQEHHPLPADVAEKGMPTSGEVLPIANPVVWLIRAFPSEGTDHYLKDEDRRAALHVRCRK